MYSFEEVEMHLFMHLLSMYLGQKWMHKAWDKLLNANNQACVRHSCKGRTEVILRLLSFTAQNGAGNKCPIIISRWYEQTRAHMCTNTVLEWWEDFSSADRGITSFAVQNALFQQTLTQTIHRTYGQDRKYSIFLLHSFCSRFRISANEKIILTSVFLNALFRGMCLGKIIFCV